MPAPSILISATISFDKLSLIKLSHSSTVPQMIWQQTSSQNPCPSGRSHHICVPSGYVMFEGECWVFVMPRVRASAHPTHQRTPGLCLEQTPKSNFWDPLGPCAPYCMLSPSPPPLLIILPCPPSLVHYTFDSSVSHPIGHMFPTIIMQRSSQ
jgi:hypothetical protein